MYHNEPAASMCWLSDEPDPVSNTSFFCSLDCILGTSFFPSIHIMASTASASASAAAAAAAAAVAAAAVMLTRRHILVVLAAALLSAISTVRGQDLVGPGAMAPYGGRGGRRRTGGYVRVQDPAKGFFVTGSSIRSMNGLYGRVDSVSATLPHQFQLAYKHDQTGWLMGLVSTPDRQSISNLESEWLFIDNEEQDRFAHKGNTLIPGAGERWKHVHRTKAANDFSSKNGAPSSDLIAHKDDDIDELPWQIIAILDEGMLRRLRRAYAHYTSTINRAQQGHGLPAPPSTQQRSSETEPPETYPEIPEVLAQVALGDYASAIEIYEKEIAQLRATRADVHSAWNQAVWLVRKSQVERRGLDIEAATQSLQTALSLFPRYKDAIFNLGVVCLQGGRVHDAIMQFLSILSFDRSYPELSSWVVRAAAVQRRVQAVLEPMKRRHLISQGETLTCIAWRQTGDCDPSGPREAEYDLSCSALVTDGHSGYCECRLPKADLGVLLDPPHGRTAESACMHQSFTCASACERLWGSLRLLAAKEDPGYNKISTWMKSTSQAVAARAQKAQSMGMREIEISAWRQADHYATLNVSFEHSADELKRAYRKESRRVHPDKPGGSDEAFQRVASAFQVLSDPEARASYDMGSDLDDPHAGPDEMGFRETVEREYFPENFPFEPFGDPFERKRVVEDRLRLERRHSQTGGDRLEHPDL